jgi:hypothetical protein
MSLVSSCYSTRGWRRVGEVEQPARPAPLGGAGVHVVPITLQALVPTVRVGVIGSMVEILTAKCHSVWATLPDISKRTPRYMQRADSHRASWKSRPTDTTSGGSPSSRASRVPSAAAPASPRHPCSSSRCDWPKTPRTVGTPALSDSS